MPGPRTAAASLLLVLAVGALVLGRSEPPAALGSHPLAAPAETRESGRLIFLRDCAFCHGADATGTNRGPSLQGVGAADVDFYLSTGRMPVTEEVQDPQRKASAYDAGEIARIVSYVDSLGAGTGTPIPQVDLSAASLTDGEKLYTENCASCHSSVAAGGALTNGRYAPTLRPSTPIQIAEAIRVGPGTMPLFGTDTLSDAQVDSIVRYVIYLQHPDDRGGLNLSHIGPITEGMIALVVGLGALLAVVRKIGTAVGD
ncbi:MAG: c-type cytochrome [Actinomycetota bacterium]|nr:c-type cytochrome [Actinomycetota bacterium]